jgi:hypothetical protein
VTTATQPTWTVVKSGFPHEYHSLEIGSDLRVVVLQRENLPGIWSAYGVAQDFALLDTGVTDLSVAKVEALRKFREVLAARIATIDAILEQGALT